MMGRRVISLSAMFLLLAVAALRAPLCLAAEIRGTVLTEARSPVIGGSVVVRPEAGGGKEYRATTGKDGSFLVPDLAFGTYTIEISRAGFVPIREKNVGVFRLVSRLEFELQIADAGEGGVEEGAHLVGNLRDGDLTLAGAEICLEGLPERRCVTTSVGGSYDFVMRLGVFSAEVRVGGKRLWTQRIDLRRAGEYRDTVRR